jgi:hypothetical protein
MDIRTNNTDTTKVTDRLNRLCISTRNLSKKDSSALSYILEKSSKIASVTLLVADVLDGNSELKSELQRSAIGLVRDAAKSVHSLEKRDSFFTYITTLVTIVDTAGRAGQLSRMNAETLSDELLGLGEFVHAIDWSRGRRYIDEGYFGESAPRELFVSEPTVKETETYKSHSRDMYVRPSQPRQTYSDSYTHAVEKDTEQKQSFQYKERVQEVQKDRRATILGLVQKKDRISVKDVASVIKDCSEKTLQRELLALVKQGVLKKEGERRWSTYSLA